ncbi:CRE-SRH-50 protein [Caenorhabditis remanei]|uniref:CRE-SRH-50 protein n=1 Tax=Caenorhabditis remanei TaxID=31234 RepID=E3LUY6_CAERE|nr:CRE-SRH-50 protein [Caenorhabditis remanei]
MSSQISLQDYFLTNYTKCSQSFSILSTPEFLSISSKTEFILILPINIFGFYCIVFHSPRYMKEFQWHLFHLQFWFLMLTVFYSLLTTPFQFYPAQVRCSIGLLHHLNISSQYQMCIVHFVYSGIATSVIALFENRHKHLVPSTDIFYRINNFHRILIGILNFSAGLTNSMPVLMQDESQELLKLKYLEVLPCPINLYFDSCSFAVVKKADIWSTLAYSSNLLIAIEIIFLVVHSYMYLRKSQLITTFSARTKQLQKAFFKAAIAQASAPIFVLVVPIFLLAYVYSTGAYLQGLINICILFIPANSVLSTASLLIFNAPYRNFLKQLLVSRTAPEVSSSRVAAISSV